MKKFIAVLALAAIGCTPGVSITRVGEAPAKLQRTDKVDVYYKAAAVTRRFRPIAELVADDKGWQYNYSVLEDMIVGKAKGLGANGVIFHEPEEEAGGGYTLRGALVVPKPEHTVMKATAIIYLN